MAQDFAQSEKVSAALFTDQGRDTYRAIGARKGKDTVYNMRAALAAARALSQGHLQSATAGHVTQQGGELVVSPAGEVRFLHLAEFAGDHADIDTVLAAI